MLILFSVVLFGCSPIKQNNKQQTDSMNLELEGFWIMEYSQYTGEKTPEQSGCPIPDVPIEWIYQPRALGSHILIKNDSISLFRYPYEYYGTFKYEIIGDSLFVESNGTFTNIFLVKKNDSDTLTLYFEEEFTSTCILSSETKYVRISPDFEIINKLIQDSISCDSLIGKWWYLRKEISYEDGTEPTILNFPQGMPDSIFVSPEIINQAIYQPFIELKLDNRSVKMFFKSPSKSSFTLIPEFKKDKILFADFIDYQENGGIDTIYYDVIYRN
ncbi:MAG: hypothetical protein ABIJ97_14845 [Bacteroidota bacterium]